MAAPRIGVGELFERTTYDSSTMILRTRLTLGLVALAMVTVACVPGDNGPWLDENGEVVSNAHLLEYKGLVACDQRSVTFFQIFGRQYAKDPNGVLGDLVSLDGFRVLEFSENADLPDTATPLGIRHGGRELYYNEPDVEDYLYIVIDAQVVERWPRAETRCTSRL